MEKTIKTIKQGKAPSKINPILQSFLHLDLFLEMFNLKQDSGFNYRLCGKYATQSKTREDPRPSEDQTKSTIAQVKSGSGGHCTRLYQIFCVWR